MKQKKRRKKTHKEPLNLTINPRVRELADLVMKARCYDSISVFVEDLIRDEYERRVERITVITVPPIEPPSPEGGGPSSPTSPITIGPGGVPKSLADIALASQEEAEALAGEDHQERPQSPTTASPNDNKPEPTVDDRKAKGRPHTVQGKAHT